MMNAGLEPYASFDDQLYALLDIIESKLDDFKQLGSRYDLELSCAIFTYSGNEESTPWVHLDKRYNQIATLLNMEFDLDLYAW